MKVCLASSRLLWNATLGGHAWVNLNWVLGLEAVGAEVTLIESFPERHGPEEALAALEGLLREARGLGVRAAVALLPAAGPECDRLAGVRAELERRTRPFDEAAADADLLLNFNYSLPQETVDRFARSALVDIDPGLLQMWLSGGAFAVARHHVNFTIGETVGTPDARFSDCGMQWVWTPPPVHLRSWPPRPPVPGAPWTTVTNWWGEYEVDRGEPFNNEKRTAFLEVLDLPRRTASPLELAIYHEPGNWNEFSMLQEHGWRARPAHEVSATASGYRAYLQGSRGEFSCVKPSCVRFQNAWISDRTICYLASARPAVVAHTGPSRFLPEREGLLRFRTPEEAVACLEEAEADYERLARAARALAEEHFDAERIAARVLERAVP